MASRVNKIDHAGVVHGFRSGSTAPTWEDALITGNGRHGALCHGDAAALAVTFSHELLFAPVTPPLDPPHLAGALPELRKLLYEGRYQDAADRVCALAAEQHPGYTDTRWIDPLIGAATLTWHSLRPGRADRHERGVDFGTGVVTQRARDDAGWLVHETFASRTDDMIVIRTSTIADGPEHDGDPSDGDSVDSVDSGSVDGVLRLGPIDGRPPVRIDVDTRVGPHELRLAATFPDAWDGAVTGYTVTCRVRADGGTVTVADGGLRVTGARELLILAWVEVTGGLGPTAARRDLPGSSAGELLARHAAVHGELFGRVSLTLGDRLAERPPAEEPPLAEDLLADPADPALVQRLFDAGRYAIISASGQLPPTLQGVWSGSYEPAWRSGYTLDGNLPTALAAALPTATPELLTPLFDLLDRYTPDFRRNARRIYGAGGILLPVHCSAHGRQNHFGPVWCQTFWTTGAAWLARFHYDHWSYTGDDEFLVTRALPFMRAAAEFQLDFLDERDGGYVFAPSYSPENRPVGTGSQATINATADVAAVRDLLRNLIEGTEHARRAGFAEAGTDADLDRWRTVLNGLPRYRTGVDGVFAEWLWPGLEDNHAHRHASHLYPVWYDDPDLLADPALRAAAVRTIQRRLAWWRGDEHGREVPGEMAFGLVQLGLAAAALGEAGLVEEILTRLAGGFWRPSLVSTHNEGTIFNVDICGGFPALVVAALVRSAPGRVDLLPALPAAWPTGEIRGVACHGRLTVGRLAWAPGLLEVELVSPVEREIMVHSPGAVSRIALRPGQPAALVLPGPRPRGAGR